MSKPGARTSAGGGDPAFHQMFVELFPVTFLPATLSSRGPFGSGTESRSSTGIPLPNAVSMAPSPRATSYLREDLEHVAVRVAEENRAMAKGVIRQR